MNRDENFNHATHLSAILEVIPKKTNFVHVAECPEHKIVSRAMNAFAKSRELTGRGVELLTLSPSRLVERVYASQCEFNNVFSLGTIYSDTSAVRTVREEIPFVSSEPSCDADVCSCLINLVSH